MPDRFLEITRDGDRLFLQGLSQGGVAGPKFEVFAENEKNFIVKQPRSKFTFETGPNGRATSLVMKRVGREPMSATRLTYSRCQSICQGDDKYESFSWQ